MGGMMEASGVYGPTSLNGLLTVGENVVRPVVPFVTEVKAAGVFEPTPADGQDFCKKDRAAFKELRERTGRAQFFFKQYEKVALTGGYVFSPCTEKNQCLTVFNGDF